jgi:hypothetical protein
LIIIIHPEHRSKGLGKIMTVIDQGKAKEEGMIMMLYRKFHGASILYNITVRKAFICKIINEDGLS